MTDVPFVDTIAAIATPAGAGGIAVIRISGSDSPAILSRLFVPTAKKENFCFIPRYMHHGHIRASDGAILDEVLCVVMPGPGSATGEDTAEIHCHGGVGVTGCILEEVLRAGARPALPGEFTKRAFLTGKLDLTQAEAVAELIAAPTRQGVRLAQAKLDGLLGRRINQLRNHIDALRMQVMLAVDFPDEDAELLAEGAFPQVAAQAKGELDSLLEGLERARLWREGATAVLAGCVNAGKSSLFNALLGRERALVACEPGTTRDYLEEQVSLNGLPVRILDTAGLRVGADSVEQQGIERSRELAAQADLVLLVVDVTRGLQAEDHEFLAQNEAAAAQGRLIVVWNKADLLPQGHAALPSCGDLPAYLVSARTGQGLDSFARAMRERLVLSAGGETQAGDIAPNLRQTQLLEQARTELAALEQECAVMPADILGVRLDYISGLLDAVIGSAGVEELLDTIFSRFCIGK